MEIIKVYSSIGDEIDINKKIDKLKKFNPVPDSNKKFSYAAPMTNYLCMLDLTCLPINDMKIPMQLLMIYVNSEEDKEKAMKTIRSLETILLPLNFTVVLPS